MRMGMLRGEWAAVGEGDDRQGKVVISTCALGLGKKKIGEG